MGNVKMKDAILTDNGQIMCPYCKGIRGVIPQKTTAYSSTGRSTVCDESEQKTNRNGVSICYYCYSCDHYFEMYISCHVDPTHNSDQIGWTKTRHISKEDIRNRNRRLLYE